MDKDRIILHCDMNAFYASVELLSHPDLAERPVAVCGDPEMRRGIILAKNEHAKRYGIVTAETIAQAKRKCPSLVLLRAHHDKYNRYCKLINDIYYRFTDMVEPFSIDESWLDVTASERLFGTGEEIARTIKAAVKSELGLTQSVGVSWNKIFAKMGSEYKKPDAVTVIDRTNYKEILWPLPVRELFSVGRATAEKLHHMGIRSIGDLAAADRRTLKHVFGKQGEMLSDYAGGLENAPVRAASERRKIKSVGNGVTFRRDLLGRDDIMIALTALSDTVSGRLRKYGLKCSGVKVDVKDPEFK
ncbi:MAG: DNA polymerase IV, partial [Clostridiales Family XIII bacterium]|nr:DNA polymerase IV [Clostridiales Family XIII bacterium]